MKICSRYYFISGANPIPSATRLRLSRSSRLISFRNHYMQAAMQLNTPLLSLQGNLNTFFGGAQPQRSPAAGFNGGSTGGFNSGINSGINSGFNQSSQMSNMLSGF